jgi:hypothetical protein
MDILLLGKFQGWIYYFLNNFRDGYTTPWIISWMDILLPE